MSISIRSDYRLVSLQNINNIVLTKKSTELNNPKLVKSTEVSDVA